MEIHKILPDAFGCNSYILSSDGKDAVIIDCAEPSLFKECTKRNLNPVAVFLTHGHFDHVGGCGVFSAHGVPIYCGRGEEEYIFSAANKAIFGGVYIPDFKITQTLKDGESITVGGITLQAIFSPGHTSGGVCYKVGDKLFTGDTLFKGGFGRTDLPTGDMRALVSSIKRLFALDGDYKVYCGHGGETTLSQERKYNPVRSE